MKYKCFAIIMDEYLCGVYKTKEEAIKANTGLKEIVECEVIINSHR